MNRRVMAGLVVVALCAAVLSFDAIRALALLCGFTPALSLLLPLTVDVGAAVATALWLATDAPRPARDYARALALVLLVASVAANGLSHGLSAYQLTPPWWVVVLVSAAPAGVLGACVHLVVLSRVVDHTAGVEGTGSAPAPVVPPAAPASGVVAPAQEQPPPDLDEETVLAARMSPAAFAEHRLEHGATAGVKKLRKHYPALTEHQARQVSETARSQHAARRTPRLVVGGER